MAYGRGLAEEIVSGRLDPAALERMPDEAALAELVRLKGIGRWSAEVYLLFALGRLDVWPAGDLALAVAVQRNKRLDARPDVRRSEERRVAKESASACRSRWSPEHYIKYRLAMCSQPTSQIIESHTQSIIQ